MVLSRDFKKHLSQNRFGSNEYSLNICPKSFQMEKGGTEDNSKFDALHIKREVLFFFISLTLIRRPIGDYFFKLGCALEASHY